MNAPVQTNLYLNILHRFALDLLRRSSLEEIYWLIADQVIAGLGFTDCVIYLRDDETDRLIQKAAYGPKTAGGHIIKNPITIAMGDGIVGSAAATGVPVRINDTRLDARYIIDDDVRLSELAVPIMLDERCIGVIDSEHHEADFYTQEHEDLLSTIASMAATKLRDALHEQALHATISELEKARLELVQQHEELHQARQVAETASKAKTTFLAHISHELRTPMTGILGMAQLLEDTPLNNDQKAYLGMVHDSANNMMSVVEQLLDLTALDSDSVVLNESVINFIEEIEAFSFTRKQQCSNVGLTFSVHLDAALPQNVRVDKNRLLQLLSILFNNALKFTREGGIAFRVSKLAEESASEQVTLQFEVQDTGIGIDESKIEELFEPFTQSDMSSSRSYEGIGLGLAIASKLAEVMGGKIWCQSNNPQGASFFFTVKVGSH